MTINQSPRRLPTNFIAIAASVMIASTGYMLFSVRYGEPIRKGNRTASRMDSLEHELPGMIKDAVDTEFAKTTAGVSGELSVLLAESEASRESLARRVVQLEDEIANIRVSVQQFAAGAPTPTNIQTPQTSQTVQSPQPGIPVTNVPASSQGTNPPTATPQLAINKPLASVQEGDIRIDILTARVVGKKTMIEMMVTKLTTGDGYFAMTHLTSDIHRMVTADGFEFDNIRVGRPGKSGSSRVNLDLISGVPMRLVMIFQGQAPAAPFLAKRIEFTAYEDRERDFQLLFQFENIAVSK